MELERARDAVMFEVHQMTKDAEQRKNLMRTLRTYFIDVEKRVKELEDQVD